MNVSLLGRPGPVSTRRNQGPGLCSRRAKAVPLLRLSIAALLISTATSAYGQCAVTGTTATCTGTRTAPDFPELFLAPAVESIAVGETFSGTADGTEGLVLKRLVPAGPGDLTVTMAPGARMVLATPDPARGLDAFYIDNEAGGSNTVVVGGVIEAGPTIMGAMRAVRIFSERNAPTDTDRIEVQPTADLRTAGNTVWIRQGDDAFGAIEIDIAGSIFSNGTHAMQISAYNPANTAPISGRVREGAAAVSGGQGLYVGTAGTRPTSVLVEGRVEGGTGGPLGIFGPMGGIIFDTVNGATLDIAATGEVSALNDRAVADIDGFRYTPVAGGLTMTNAGSLTGFVEFGGGDDSLENSGTWLLRNFADTNRDGVRDTVADTTIAFGDGVDQLTNTGVIRLSSLEDGLNRAAFTGLETFRNAGRLSLADAEAGGAGPVAGDVIDLDGDYVGQGGTLVFDTELGGPGAISDQLRVAGDVTGRTQIDIVPIDMGGTPDDQGVLLVEVGGTSDPAAFALGRPVELGAFVFDLEQGAPDDAADQNWYLRSAGRVGTAGAVYEAVPGIVLGTFGRLPTHDQRLGRSGPPAPSGPKTWARIAGTRLDWTPERSNAGLSAEIDHGALQLGIELGRADTDTGTWVFGLTGQYGRVDATVSNAEGQGTIGASGGGIGATATWYGQGGTYADIQLQVNQVTLDLASASQGRLAGGVDTALMATSVELGHRVPVGARAALIPQGQLTAARHLTSGFTDERGTEVGLGDTSSVLARLGLAYEVDAPTGAAGSGQDRLYVIGNLLRDFGGDSAVDVGGATLEQSDDRLWGELGLGASVATGRNSALYAEGSYRRAMGAGARDDALALTAGFRLRF